MAQIILTPALFDGHKTESSMGGSSTNSSGTTFLVSHTVAYYPPYYTVTTYNTGYISFNLSQLQGLEITNVKLRLYCDSSVGGNVGLYSLSSPASGFPSTGSVVHSGVTSSVGWMEFSIPVSRLSANGWALLGTTHSSTYFRSSEYSSSTYRPQLVITYIDPNAVPSASLTSCNGTETLPTEIADLTPTLSWNYSDADGDPQDTYQVVVTGETSGVVYNSGVVSSAAISVALPSPINPGEKYHWYVIVTDGQGGSKTSATGYFIVPIVAPAVTTLDASGIGAFEATIGGNVSDTGNENVSRKIFWGTADGGTSASAWDDVASVGTGGAGDFTALIDGLYPGSTYYFKAYANNTAGGSWGITKSFTASKKYPVLTPEVDSAVLSPNPITAGNLLDISISVSEITVEVEVVYPYSGTIYSGEEVI